MDGQGVKHVSASQIKAFRRCRSRWYHEKVDGHVEPPSEAMKRGTRIHAALEAYLVDGTPLPDDADGRIARPALTRLPPGGSVPREQVERRFETPAEVYGLPLIGVIDLVEPDVITDHKTTSDFKYTKTEEELKADPQAQAYAIERGRTESGPIRFRHLYIRTSGAPQSRETIVDFSRQDLADALTRLRATVSSMVETSRIDDVADVGHNLEACGDYGGCPHRARCAVLGRQTLGVISTLFSNRKDRSMDTNDPLAAMLAARSINPPDGTPQTEPPEPDPQCELDELEPDKVVSKRRAMRLPGAFDEEGVAVLVSRASKPQLIEFATENKILVEPPEGRSKAGIREYRAAVESFVAFTGEDPEEVDQGAGIESGEETPTLAITPDPTLDTPAKPFAGIKVPFDAPPGEAPGVVEPTIAGLGSGFVETPKTNGDLLTIYLNCCPRGPVTYLEELLAPIQREVEKESGAPHYLAIPYSQGPKRVAGVFAHQIRNGLVEMSGAIVADLRLPASEAAVEVLLQYADEVVRRF